MGSTGTTFISSDISIATVSQNGLVTAVSYGIVIITATNSQFSDTAEVTVSIPPTIESFSPSPGAKINQTQITVTGTLNQDNVQVTVNGQSAMVTARTFSAPGIALTDGSNAITIIAQNALGLEDIETFSVFVDSIPPIVTIISPPDGRGVSVSRISLTGEIADAHLITTFLINNMPAQFHENLFSHLVPLSEGDNTITVYVQDEFGNKTTKSIQVVYTPETVDLVPPEITLSAPSEGKIFSSSPIQVIGRVVDDSPIKELTMNGASISLTGLGFSAMLNLSEGENTITIAATDAHDNTSTFSLMVFLDSTPPSGPQNVSISPSSPTNSDRVFLSGAAEPGSRIEVTGGAELFSTTVSETGDFNLTVFLKENTKNLLRICTVDKGGHRSPEQMITIVQDSVAPRIIITTPSSGAVLPTESVTVAGTIEDKSPIALISINGRAASLISGSQFSQSIELPEGENTIAIQATDAANNAGTASIPVTVQITPEGEPDNEPPIITIISPQEGSYHNHSPIPIKGSIMDTSSISHIHINGVPLNLGSELSGDIFTGNAYLEENSETTITIEAADEHGNIAGISITIFHDTIPPSQPVPEDVPEETNLSRISIRGQAEPLSMVTITGGEQTATARADEEGAFGQVIGLNLNVINNLSVTCADRAGNESEPAYLQVRQDSTPPQVSSVSPENGQKGIEPDTTIYVKFNEKIDCTTVSGNVSLLANGTVLSSAFDCVDAGTSLLFQDDRISVLPPDTQFELRISTDLTDVAGNGLSSQYRSFFYTKDTHAPNPPVITSELPEATRYRQIKITGKTEANATIIITGGSADVEAAADEKGGFSAQVALLPNIANNLSLVARDVSGNESVPTQIAIRHDDVPPGITITPEDGASGISCQASMDIRFSEPIKINTLISRIGLYQGDQKVPATLISDATNTSARYIPENLLLSQKTYTLRISSGVTDQPGNQTPSDVISTFTTQDVTPPPEPVITSYPDKTRETQVNIAGEAEAGATIILTGGANGTTSIETQAGTDGTFTINVTLVPDTLNHLSFVSQDASGNQSKPVQVSITQDSTGPSVARVLPDGKRKVRFDTNIHITFSEEVQPSSVQGRISLLDPQGRNISGALSVSQGGKVATFTPAGPLQQDQTYTIQIGPGLSDMLGNTSADTFTSTFTTMVDTSFPEEPVVTSIEPPSPTQSQTVNITGNTTPYCQVEITGGAQPAQTQSDGEGKFVFDAVQLNQNQENNLLITATNPVNSFNCSKSIIVIHDDMPPEVTIKAPTDGITLSKTSVTIIGSVKDLCGVESVIVTNGEHSLNITPDNGMFLGSIKLDEGENTIQAAATDFLGHQGTASIHITRIIEPEGTDTTTPVITITYPEDGTTILQDKVLVEGTVEDNDPGITASLLVNGKAPDTLIFNMFGALVELSQDINTITATAQDAAENTGTRTITVYTDTQEVPTPQLESLPQYTDLLVIPIKGATQPGMSILAQGADGDCTTQADATGAFTIDVQLYPNKTNHLKIYAVAQSGKKSTPAEVSIEQDAREPEVIAFSPADRETMVDPGTDIVVTFSEPMDANSITTETFLVSHAQGEIQGALTFTPQGSIVTFTPASTLPRGEEISIRLLASIPDQHGYQLSMDYLSAFQVRDTPTTVSGIVVNPDLVPLEGVTITIENTALIAQTGINGLFSINEPPLGKQTLLVDGSTTISDQAFTSLSFTLLVDPGKDNNLGRPIFLTPIDQASLTRVESDQDQVLEFNGCIPGFSLEVKANSITLPDGKSNGLITATEVDINNLPARLPDDSLPAMLVNLEPSGTSIDPSCHVTFPNKMNLPPGTEVTIFGFEGGMKDYQVIGTGIVTEEGIPTPQTHARLRARASITQSNIIRSKEPCITGFSFYGYFPIEDQDTNIISTKDAYLAGRVVDVLGNGIPNVKVDVAASDTRSVTDEDGYYKVPLPERAVFQLKVFALIPTTLADVSGTAQYAVFASDAIEVGPETITEVPDIVVDSIFIGGDIQFVDSQGLRVLPGDQTGFLNGEVISLSEETSSAVRIMAYKEKYPGIFSKEACFTTQANIEPIDPYNHCRFAKQLFLGNGTERGALLVPGDLIRIVAFSEATVYIGYRDIRIPPVIEDINIETDLLIAAPQIKVSMERVYYDDKDIRRQSIPNQGIALISDQYIYLKTTWEIQNEILPEIPVAKIYGRFLIFSQEKEQDVRFDIPPGEYTRIIDLRDIYQNRKLALDIESDIGYEALTISGSNNFSKENMLLMKIDATDESAREYKIHVFDIKIIPKEGDEDMATARGVIFPSGVLDITNIETNQVYTIEADEEGKFQIDIPLAGDQGYEIIVYTPSGLPTAPFTLAAIAYPILESLENISETIQIDPNIIAEVTDDPNIIFGTAGDILSITGKNFSENPKDNLVYINSRRVQVVDSKPTRLSVVVPEDASSGPVTVKVAGKTSNIDQSFYFISNGLPHGGFESGDLRGFFYDGTAKVVEKFVKMNPTEGQYMAYLSTSHDPRFGVSTLSTDLFFVPEGMKTLSLDFDIMATGFTSDLKSLILISLKVPGEADRYIVPLSSQTKSFIGSAITGYEINTLFQTLSIDVSDLAGTRKTVRLIVQLFGIGNKNFARPGLVSDDDSSEGGDKLRGTGLLIDHLRLSDSGQEFILSPLEDKISFQLSAENGFSKILGDNGAIMALGRVVALNLITGTKFSAEVNFNGSFELNIYNDIDDKSYYGLQIEDISGNISPSIMILLEGK